MIHLLKVRVALSLLFVQFLFLIFFCGCSSEPKTYEDCILQNMQKAQSENAAKAISYACRQKFPPPANPFDRFDQPQTEQKPFTLEDAKGMKK